MIDDKVVDVRTKGEAHRESVTVCWLRGDAARELGQMATTTDTQLSKWDKPLKVSAPADIDKVTTLISATRRGGLGECTFGRGQ